MAGFSGGGQFTNRLLYLHPERLDAVSTGAPGRVTMLDENLKWPAGIKDVFEVFDGVVINKSKIRDVNIQLVVGRAGYEVHGREFWPWLAKKERTFEGERLVGRWRGVEEACCTFRSGVYQL